MSDRPNILFIISDQHNAKVLGCNDHPSVKTPHIDRMAAEGVRFRNAVTQNPICTPSRVSFLSGQYCHNHGYYGLSGPNPNGLPSVLGHFRRDGYRTAAVGKIHCPEYWIEDDADVFHETCGCSIGGRSKAYSDFLGERESLEDHGTMRDFGPAGQQSMEGRPSELTFEESQEGWIASTVIDFMRESADAGAPFFAHASLPRPHQCTAPSEPFWSMYGEDDLVLPPNADDDLEGRAPHMRAAAERWRRGGWALMEPRTFEAARLRKLHGYLGAVSQVDHAVGLMLDFLRDNGLAENTVVVYTADHGDYACEHGIMEKAPGICSDAITRIPSVWWAPGRLAEGHVADEIVEAVDLAPTVCSLAGLDPLETADGADLSDLLGGGSGEVHPAGLTEFAWSKSLRVGDLRYVHYPPAMFPEEHPDGFCELYDLAADPWETTNLALDPAYADAVADMRRRLVDRLIETTRPVTVHPAVPDDDGALDDQRRYRYQHAVNADGKMPPRWIASTGRTYV